MRVGPKVGWGGELDFTGVFPTGPVLPLAAAARQRHVLRLNARQVGRHSLREHDRRLRRAVPRDEAATGGPARRAQPRGGRTDVCELDRGEESQHGCALWVGAVLWQLLTRDCVGCSGEAASRAPSFGACGRRAPMPVPRAAPHDARGRAGAGRGAAAHRRAECVGDVASVRLRASLAARRCDQRSFCFLHPPAGA